MKTIAICNQRSFQTLPACWQPQPRAPILVSGGALKLFVRLFLALGAVGFSFAADKPVDFDRDVRPILSDNCFACHGPDDKRRVANLRLDTEEGLFADRGTYKIVVPGDPAQSRILARISAANRAARMPPPQAGATLSDAQVDTIRKWIGQGARWERHWAFVPPQRPALPAVRNAKWVRNPIDRFVLARLERPTRPRCCAVSATI